MGKGRLNYFKWKIEPTSKLCLPTKWTVISKKPIGSEFRLRDGPFGRLRLAGDGCENHYVRIIKKTKDVTGATSSITVEGYLGVYNKTGLASMDKLRKERRKIRSSKRSKTKKSVISKRKRDLLMAVSIGAILGSIYYYLNIASIESDKDYKKMYEAIHFASPSQQKTFRGLTTKELFDVKPSMNEKTLDEKTLRSIFRKASIRHHPDKGGNPETFKELNNLKEDLFNQMKEKEKYKDAYIIFKRTLETYANKYRVYNSGVFWKSFTRALSIPFSFAAIRALEENMENKRDKKNDRLGINKREVLKKRNKKQLKLIAFA